MKPKFHRKDEKITLKIDFDQLNPKKILSTERGKDLWEYNKSKLKID